MMPDTWGKHLWFSIHFIALDYPENPSSMVMAEYKSFFENLWKVIPCYKCSVNYKRHLSELPISDYLDSRESLFAWTVELHNIVNKETGKPVMRLDEARKKYLDPEFNKKLCDPQHILQIAMTKNDLSNNTNKIDNQYITYVLSSFLLGIVLGGVLYFMITKYKVKVGKIKVPK